MLDLCILGEKQVETSQLGTVKYSSALSKTQPRVASAVLTQLVEHKLRTQSRHQLCYGITCGIQHNLPSSCVRP